MALVQAEAAKEAAQRAAQPYSHGQGRGIVAGARALAGL